MSTSHLQLCKSHSLNYVFTILIGSAHFLSINSLHLLYPSLAPKSLLPRQPELQIVKKVHISLSRRSHAPPIEQAVL